MSNVFDSLVSDVENSFKSVLATAESTGFSTLESTVGTILSNNVSLDVASVFSAVKQALADAQAGKLSVVDIAKVLVAVGNGLVDLEAKPAP